MANQEQLARLKLSASQNNGCKEWNRWRRKDYYWHTYTDAGGDIHNDMTRYYRTDIDLTNADFSKRDLTGANLAIVNLTGANLSGANLTGADLSGANLTGANLSTTAAVVDGDDSGLA